MKTDDHQIEVPAAIFGKEAKASSVPRGYEILSQHDSVGSDWGPDWLKVSGSFQWVPSKSGHTHDPVYLWYPVLSRSTQSVVLIRFLDVGRDANGRPHSLRAEAAFLDISDEEMKRTLLSSLLAGNVDWTLSKSDQGPILTIAFSKVAADDLSSNADPTHPVLIAPLPVSIQTSLDLEGWKLLSLGSGASFSDREVTYGHYRESSKNTSPPRETSAPRHEHLQPSQVRLPHTPTFWERNGWKFFFLTSFVCAIVLAIGGHFIKENRELVQSNKDFKQRKEQLEKSIKQLKDFHVRNYIGKPDISDEQDTQEYRNAVSRWKEHDEFFIRLSNLAPKVSELVDSLRNAEKWQLENLDVNFDNEEWHQVVGLTKALQDLKGYRNASDSDGNIKKEIQVLIANYKRLVELSDGLEQFRPLLNSTLKTIESLKEHDPTASGDLESGESMEKWTNESTVPHVGEVDQTVKDTVEDKGVDLSGDGSDTNEALPAKEAETHDADSIHEGERIALEAEADDFEETNH